MELGGQCHAPGALTPEKRPGTRPKGLCGRMKKILSPPRFDPQTVQAVSYIYYAIPANVTLHAEYDVYESRRSRPQVNRLERWALYAVGPVSKLAKSQLLDN